VKKLHEFVTKRHTLFRNTDNLGANKIMSKRKAMVLYVPLFCLFCVFMVYNDYINRRREPSVEIVIVLPEDIYKAVIEDKVVYGAEKKQIAKRDKQGKKTVSPRSNESKNF